MQFIYIDKSVSETREEEDHPVIESNVDFKMYFFFLLIFVNRLIYLVAIFS